MGFEYQWAGGYLTVFSKRWQSGDLSGQYSPVGNKYVLSSVELDKVQQPEIFVSSDAFSPIAKKDDHVQVTWGVVQSSQLQSDLATVLGLVIDQVEQGLPEKRGKWGGGEREAGETDFLHEIFIVEGSEVALYVRYLLLPAGTNRLQGGAIFYRKPSCGRATFPARAPAPHCTGQVQEGILNAADPVVRIYSQFILAQACYRLPEFLICPIVVIV
jgi:hypothetical protein